MSTRISCAFAVRPLTAASTHSDYELPTRVSIGKADRNWLRIASSPPAPLTKIQTMLWTPRPCSAMPP